MNKWVLLGSVSLFLISADVDVIESLNKLLLPVVIGVLWARGRQTGCVSACRAEPKLASGPTGSSSNSSSNFCAN